MDLGATKKKLTPKERKFVQEICKGTNPSEAYIKAYDSETTNKMTIKTSAQKILRKPHIITTIQEHNKQVEEELIYTAKDSFANLSFAQEKAIEQGNMNAYLKAEELKGKLLGLYTEKKDIELKGQQTIFVDKKLDE